MQIVESVRELQSRADALRAAGQRIALVPTMGALHEGHLRLVDAARAKADRVWVSIFVNPTQFGPSEDLARYPRPREADLEKCRSRGVDLVFLPREGDLYPEGHQTWVEVPELSQPLCGAGRPGHFRGVATVVSVLLLAAKPHVAVFGEKDFQQLAVIRRLVRDLRFDVEIVGVPTAREPDGLALSSRNLHLAADARRQAVSLSRALAAAERAVGAGCCSAGAVLEAARSELARAPLGRVEYAELRDPQSLEPAPDVLSGPALLALAVRFPSSAGGEVRLIDSRVLHPHPSREERS